MTSTLTKISEHELESLVIRACSNGDGWGGGYHSTSTPHLWACSECGEELHDLSVILFDLEAGCPVCPFCDLEISLVSVECEAC